MNVGFFMIFQNKRGIFFSFVFTVRTSVFVQIVQCHPTKAGFFFSAKKSPFVFPLFQFDVRSPSEYFHNCPWKESGFYVTIEKSNR